MFSLLPLELTTYKPGLPLTRSLFSFPASGRSWTWWKFNSEPVSLGLALGDAELRTITLIRPARYDAALQPTSQSRSGRQPKTRERENKREEEEEVEQVDNLSPLHHQLLLCGHHRLMASTLSLIWIRLINHPTLNTSAGALVKRFLFVHDPDMEMSVWVCVFMTKVEG